MIEIKNFGEDVASDTFCITLVPTVPVLLPVRSAYGSFFYTIHTIHSNTPPMSLADAHLGGFFF